MSIKSRLRHQAPPYLTGHLADLQPISFRDADSSRQHVLAEMPVSESGSVLLPWSYRRRGGQLSQ